MKTILTIILGLQLVGCASMMDYPKGDYRDGSYVDVPAKITVVMPPTKCQNV